MARKFFGVVAAVALAGGVMFALVGPASAGTQGPNFLFIEKSVSGGVPSGTVFSVQVSCTSSGTTTVWFDDTGHASDSAGNQIVNAPLRPNATDTCTVTETHSGGASTVNYSCALNANNNPAPETTCTSSNVVRYIDVAGDEATVTVANTFNTTTTTTSTTIPPAVVTTLPPATTTTKPAPKPAAQPVVAPAHFTG